jgi:hypothetical protein
VVDDTDDLLVISDDGTIHTHGRGSISELRAPTQGVRLMRVAEGKARDLHRPHRERRRNGGSSGAAEAPAAPEAE